MNRHGGHDAPHGRILVGCFRGMGDLLYVSSILAELRATTSPDIRIDLAAGRGLWADAVRHVPGVDRVIPVDSWEEIGRLGRAAGADTRLARVSAWMPFSMYRGWSLRARLGGLHLVDVLARALDVPLPAAHRRPVYHFHPHEPEDDAAAAVALGRYTVVALHGFTHAGHNEAAARRLLPPLLEDAARTGRRLVLVGPPGEALELPPSVFDARGRSIRPIARLVERAALVVSVLNGITVLADALERPILLLALGNDPLAVVGPIHTPPVATLGRPGRAGARGIDPDRLRELVAQFTDGAG